MEGEGPAKVPGVHSARVAFAELLEQQGVLFQLRKVDALDLHDLLFERGQDFGW